MDDADKARPASDARYGSKLARAQTMLAVLAAMLEQHAKDQAARKSNRDYADELDAFCNKLGEAAICITTTL